jgi:thiol-disulfide isomerase/thioredoxin
MAQEQRTDDGAPVAIDERPQRRREWSGPIRSVGLPLVAVAANVVAVWIFQSGRSSGTSKPGAGQGVIKLDAARNHTGRPPAPEKGRAAPDFRLTTLDGGTERLSDLQGKTVLINFWASWCGPCRQEMPEITQAYAQYHDRGFEVVSVDEQEDPSLVRKFVNEFGMQFPVAMDGSGTVGQTYRAGNTFPTSVWVDANGVVTDVHPGPLTRQMIDQKLADLK